MSAGINCRIQGGLIRIYLWLTENGGMDFIYIHMDVQMSYVRFKNFLLK